MSGKPLNFQIQVSKGGLGYSYRSAVTSVTLWCVPVCVCVGGGGGFTKYVETKGFFHWSLPLGGCISGFPASAAAATTLIVILAMLSLNFEPKY